MMRICHFCGKTSVMGGSRKLLRGHYNPTGKKIKRANLQWLALGAGKRVKVCAKCLKSKTRGKI
ncbi:MAG: 50S ribosomal protein L28 [Candidatus Brennerbacteria bacterium]|nr:50S ribosomal protein L28 [Candidatus Brennerbacteria bacterium]